MPNGGHVCCEYCTYNRATPGTCDVFGVETSPFILCRTFRTPKQSHADARREHPMLLELKPGVVYGIQNADSSGPAPQPAYKVVPTE